MYENRHAGALRAGPKRIAMAMDNRTNRRARGLFLVALAGLFAGALGAPAAYGQSEKQLIGTSPSTCRSCPPENVTATQILAQEFSTGSDKGGYRVMSLWVPTSMSEVDFVDPDFSLWSAGGSGSPGTRIFRWNFQKWIPTSDHDQKGYLFLSAPGGAAASLDPNTTYFIVAKSNGAQISLEASRNRDRLQGGGWNIEGGHLESSDNGSNWSSHGKPLTFRLRGIIRPSPVRLDALTVTGTQIDPTETGYAYEGEIPFGTSTVTIDAQPGDTTSTLEYLFPDGSTVPDADPVQSGLQVSPITDRTRVNIKITSADNVWSETYKVRLRRMGNPVQAAATGTVTVTGDPFVNSTLEASVSNFNEPNGTFFAEGGRPWYGPDFIRNYGFHFVWYADRSTSGNTVYIVGQGRRLVLTRHMRGQRISVKYAFTDDLDNEEALYSPETEAVQAEPGTSTATTATDEEGAAALTARFAAMPAEHDGESKFRFRLVFSDEIFDGTEPLNKNEAVRDALAVTGGAATGSRRVDKAEFDEYWIDVRPSGNGPVTISLSPASSCGTSSVTCTPDGRKLTTPISTRVEGPPGLSVADANVLEGPGAALAFAVTLDRSTAAAVQVDYATRDGSAQAGSDYTAASGTLNFAPGETAKTVTVAVLDDSHDEGSETLTLVLSNPSGAYLADGEATGTIENSDLMPQAWLSRFGRTVAEQVLEAVEERIRSAPQAGVQVTVAGQRIGAAQAPKTEALEEAEAQGRLEDFSSWLAGEAEAQESRTGSRAVAPRELLTGSSFALTTGAEGIGGGLVSLWGRGALMRFDGREGELSLSGEVTGAMLGADWTRDPGSGSPGSKSGAGGAGGWTTGLMLSLSRGEGSYRGANSPGSGSGTGGKVSSTVTGLYPYGRYAVTDRVTVWGAAGYGAGTLTLTPEGGGALKTDMDLMMAAAGLRGVAVEAPAEGGPELAVKTDAMAVRTSSEATGDSAGGRLAAAEADVTRLRLGLEGTWRGLEIGTGTLVPRLEVGVRHDGGDAETGFGLDLGGGLAWSDPGTGIRAEISARGLLTHESAGFRERGIAGSFGWDPTPGSDRGPSLTLSQIMGVSARGGADALLGRTTLAGLAANDPGSGSGAGGDDERRRLELKLGYGFGALGDRFTATPEAGFGMSAGHRDYSLAWRFVRDRRRGDIGSLEFSVETRRRESANDDTPPEHAVGLRLTARF